MKAMFPALFACVFLTACPRAKKDVVLAPPAPPAGRALDPTYLLTHLKLEGITRDISMDHQPSLHLRSDGRFDGQTSVNRMSGNYKLTDTTVQFGPGIISTRMAGPPALMEIEADYLKALETVAKVTLRSDTSLKLESPDGRTALEFTKQ